MMRRRSSSRCSSRLMPGSSRRDGDGAVPGLPILAGFGPRLAQHIREIRVHFASCGADRLYRFLHGFLDLLALFFKFRFSDFFVQLSLELVTSPLEFRHESSEMASDLRQLLRAEQKQAEKCKEDHLWH